MEEEEIQRVGTREAKGNIFFSQEDNGQQCQTLLRHRNPKISTVFNNLEAFFNLGKISSIVMGGMRLKREVKVIFQCATG